MNSTLSIAGQYAGESLYEYLLVVAPDQPVTAMLVEEREAFQRMFWPEKSLGNKPHILISNFLARDEIEDTILRWLQRIVGEQRSFPVTLNNYSGYPPHTVCVRVMDTAPFREMASHLEPINDYIQSNACPPVHFNTCNHLSLAGGLPAEIYERAIAEYATKLFHESFEVNELILLRRQHRHEQCKQVAILRLQPGDQHYLKN